MQKVKREVTLPPGYTLTWGGQFENQQRASARLALVVPIALAVIFLLLFLTFDSLRQAVLVFCIVPFATVGGVIALWLSGEFLSVQEYTHVIRWADEIAQRPAVQRGIEIPKKV